LTTQAIIPDSGISLLRNFLKVCLLVLSISYIDQLLGIYVFPLLLHVLSHLWECLCC